MFRPAERTFHTAACPGPSVTCTTDPGNPSPASICSSASSRGSSARALLAGELDQEQRVGLAPDVPLHHRRELGHPARALEDGPVHQLHRDRVERHQLLRHPHRVAEPGEVADAERGRRRQGLQRQLELGEEGQRPLAAHQQLGEVGRRGEEVVEVVAAHPPEDLREAGADLLRLPSGERLEPLPQRVHRSGLGGAGWPEAGGGAVGEDRLDAPHVVHHVPVADGARAGAVVRRHASEGGPARRRGIHREEEPVGAERAVELVEHEPRLHPCQLARHVHVHDAPEVPAAVEDHCLAHRLSALRRPTTAGEDGDAGLAAEREHRLDVGRVLGEDHAQREHLVDGCIGRVEASPERIQADLALHLAAQTALQRASCERRRTDHAGLSGQGRAAPRPRPPAPTAAGPVA